MRLGATKRTPQERRPGPRLVALTLSARSEASTPPAYDLPPRITSPRSFLRCDRDALRRAHPSALESQRQAGERASCWSDQPRPTATAPWQLNSRRSRSAQTVTVEISIYGPRGDPPARWHWRSC